MLTPLDIHNKTFKKSFRGYNEDEIDDFLDDVVNDYERLFRENDQLKADLERVKKDNDQYHALEENLKQTLIVAQKTAEEIMSASRKNAEELRENTAKECQNMRQEAELRGKQMIDEALKKVSGIVADYERLVEDRKQFLRKSKLTLEAELSIISDAIAALPDREREEEPPKAEKAVKEEPKKEEAEPEKKNVVEKESVQKQEATLRIDSEVSLPADASASQEPQVQIAPPVAKS